MADRTNKIPNLRRRSQRLKRGWFAIGGQGPVTVIDLDGEMARVVQSTQQADKPEIIRYAATSLKTSMGSQSILSDPDGKKLAEALTRLKIRPSTVVMGLSRSQVFLRTLSLPFAPNLDELAAMVQFQIAKDLPFRPEDAFIDFTILRVVSLASPSKAGDAIAVAKDDKNSGGESPAMETSAATASPVAQLSKSTTGEAKKFEVLVAAVKKEVVEQFVRGAAAAGFTLSALGLRSCANARCVGLRDSSRGNHATALVSLRPDEVTIDLIVDQAPVFSRVVSVASLEPKPDSSIATADDSKQTDDPVDSKSANKSAGEDALIQAIITELVRSLHSHEGMAGYGQVQKILIAGATGKESTLASAVTQRFSTPCELFRPDVALGVKASDAEKSSGGLAALGLALGVHDPEGLPFDFLHPKRPPAPQNWRRIKLLIGATVGLVLILVLFGLQKHWINLKLHAKEQVLAQVAQAEKNRPLFREMRFKSKTVREWMAEKRDWLDHYAFLSALLPSSREVYITSLSTGARGTIHLSVQARSGDILAQIDKRLREAGYEVKPLAITPGTDKFGYPFRSSVELSLPGKMKFDLSALKPSPRFEDDGSLDAPAISKRSAPEKPSKQNDVTEPGVRRSGKTKL